VLLHGFGGTARHWDRVVALTDPERYSPVAIELSDARPLSRAGVLDLVAAVDAERFVLCGYSMGGRVALHVAAAMADRVSRLVLVSSGAGIEDERARLARAAADEVLARSIENGSIEEFVARWRRTALFAGDPEWVHEEIAADQRRLTPAQVAATLRAYGPGVLAPLWGNLGELTMPTVILVGARDATYREIGDRLFYELPHARLQAIRGVGHRVALEAPRIVVSAFAPPAPASLAWF